MLGLKSTMNIIDNSGALVAEVINVLKVKSGSGIGTVGDECVVVIKSAKPIPANLNISANSPAAANKIRRGDIRRAVIVRTKQTISRPDGRYMKFDDNAGVLINPKKELLGSRISGVIAQEVRQKGWGKIASVAPKSAGADGPAQYILKKTINKIEEMEILSPDTYVNLHWIPGHKGVEGNEKADKAANEGRTKIENKLPVDFELKHSLSALKRGLREQITAPMRIEANRLVEITSQSARIAVGRLTSSKTAKLLESLPRATRSLAVQFRTGHFPITKSYRYRFRLTDNPKCNTCRLDDTMPHRIFICRKYIIARLTLRKRINALGIRFELGPMLRNAKTLQALYEFFRPQVSSRVMTSGHSVQS